MSLVKPLSPKHNADVADLATFFNETLGFCPNSVLTMQYRPDIAKAFISLNKAVMDNHARVTSALKRLIAYMASLTAGCRYCQAHTIRAAERYEADDEKMANIWEYKNHPAFTPAERAALDFTIAASSIPNGVDEHITVAIREHWSDEEIVEILAVVALFGYLNRWNDSMGTTLEDAAIESGEKYLSKKGWSTGKHQ